MREQNRIFWLMWRLSTLCSIISLLYANKHIDKASGENERFRTGLNCLETELKIVLCSFSRKHSNKFGRGWASENVYKKSRIKKSGSSRCNVKEIRRENRALIFYSYLDDAVESFRDRHTLWNYCEMRKAARRCWKWHNSSVSWNIPFAFRENERVLKGLE